MRFPRCLWGVGLCLLWAGQVCGADAPSKGEKSGVPAAGAGVKSEKTAKKKPAKPGEKTTEKKPEKTVEKGKAEAKGEGADKGSKKEDPAGGGTGRKKGGDGNGEGRMSLPLVKGHDSKGLNIPYFDEQGRRQMTFAIGVAELVDDDHVKMKDMRIETFGEDEQREMVIELPSSVLDLNTRVLKGKEGVVVKRSDFELTGRVMDFDTRTRKGNLTGDVRMLIYNQPNEDQAPKNPPNRPDPASKPAP